MSCVSRLKGEGLRAPGSDELLEVWPLPTGTEEGESNEPKESLNTEVLRPLPHALAEFVQSRENPGHVCYSKN